MRRKVLAPKDAFSKLVYRLIGSMSPTDHVGGVLLEVCAGHDGALRGDGLDGVALGAQELTGLVRTAGTGHPPHLLPLVWPPSRQPLQLAHHCKGGGVSWTTGRKETKSKRNTEELVCNKRHSKP